MILSKVNWDELSMLTTWPVALVVVSCTWLPTWIANKFWASEVADWAADILLFLVKSNPLGGVPVIGIESTKRLPPPADVVMLVNILAQAVMSFITVFVEVVPAKTNWLGLGIL